jgi:hypothetical protein
VVSAGEQEIFSQTYESPYFFNAQVLQDATFTYASYTLDTVYRQEDSGFVELLHRIRNQSCTQADIDMINTRVQRVTTIEPGEIYISTTNARANEVNATMLSRLPGDTYCSYATISGKITPSSYPTDNELEMKV